MAETGKRSQKISDYLAIELEQLRADEAAPCDILMYFAQSMHLLVLKKSGDLIPQAFIAKYEKKGITQLWIPRDKAQEFSDYVKAAPGAEPPSFDKPAEETPPAPAEDTESLVVEVSELSRQIGEIFQTSPTEIKPQQVGTLAQEIVRQVALPQSQPSQEATNQAMRQAVSSLLDGLLEQSGSEVRNQIAELFKLADLDPELDHAANVAMFAVLFAMAFGRIDSNLLADLALAGFLHDLGVTQIPAEIVKLPWQKMTPEQQKTYTEHVSAGLALLDSFKDDFKFEIPHRVKTLIAQHHEKFDGTGYPRKLEGFKLDDVGQILAMADLLDSVASGLWDGTSRTLKETFEFLENREKARNFPEHFNPDLFGAVVQWIKSETAARAQGDAAALVSKQAKHVLLKNA